MEQWPQQEEMEQEGMHTFRQPRKAECLPITKHSYGYVQRAAYRQPDLHHEEIVELESPFASVVASGTQVYTFLLLGDQNSGKSTFMHAFCFAEDLNFLELTSYLPILASSFINTRFLADDTTPPRDELPFLDTDIARGTVLLTLDSFVFFLDEFGLPREEFPPDTRFVMVQFIEIGGDHLDSLMYDNKEGAATSREMRDILDRSAALLTQARKTIYFINASTLFARKGESDGTYEVNQASLDTLTARMNWLSEVLPPSHQILFYLSRVPHGCTLDLSSVIPAINEADRAAGLVAPLALPAGEGEPELQIKALLDHLKRVKKWRLDVVDVFRAEHLQETNAGGDTNQMPLNVDKIVGTLVRLFQSRMQHSKREAEVFTFTHVLQCWKHEFLDKQPDFYATNRGSEVRWLHTDEFAEYLEGLDFCELPETILLQQWEKVALRLVDSSLAIKRNGESRFSRFRIEGRILGEEATDPHRKAFRDDNRSGTEPAATATRSPASSDYLEVRLFYFAPLMDVLYSYFSKNIPGEFWIDHGQREENGTEESPATSSGRLSFLDDPSVRQRLGEAVQAMEGVLRSMWQALIEEAGSGGTDEEQRAVHFLWLVEEWLHAQQLLGSADGAQLKLTASDDMARAEALFDLLKRLVGNEEEGPVASLCTSGPTNQFP